jgi:DnaJ-class molecular chaperone
VYKLGASISGSPFFESFETLTDEQSLQALHESWTTLDQRLYNAMHKTCPTCLGQGVGVDRVFIRGQRPQIVRDKVGCYECKGTGAVLK